MKEILLAFATNKALISAIAAWALTQGGKNIYEGFKNDMPLQDICEMPTEVEGGPMVKHLFEYLCARLPDARLPQSDPDSYDTSAQTSGYVQRYRDMNLWEKMDLRGAMLMIMSNFMRDAKPRVWTSDERMKRVLEHIHSHVDDDVGAVRRHAAALFPEAQSFLVELEGDVQIRHVEILMDHLILHGPVSFLIKILSSI